MLGRISLVWLFMLGILFVGLYADFPQLHRALPGANGKPGYRVTSSHGGNANDNSIQHKHVTKSDKDSQHHQQKTMDFDSRWSEAAVYSIISCTLVGLSGILPLIIIPLESGPSLKHGAGSITLKLLLSFAVGSLLGDVFLHLLPEAWATVHTAEDPHWAHTVVGLWVICGVLSFMTIEKVFTDTEDAEESEDEPIKSHPVGEDDVVLNGKPASADESGLHNLKSRANGNILKNGSANGSAVSNGTANKKSTASNGSVNGVARSEIKKIENENHIKQKDAQSIHITGYLNLLANCIDNFTHGLAIAGSYLISPKVGLCTTIAILLHEVPHEVGDFAILLRSGFDRWKAAKAQVMTASGGLLGAFTALMCESAEEAGDKTSAILPFTAGGFIYIALVTVVPELLKETSAKESLKQMACVILGVVSMLLVTIIFEG
ncbi:zinc transporter ZIP13-like [Watersipora subatra]|uniref:zinc transporter ZIP13-like n=1 Tax=Watersipora subatra TaxID=2589382 RepID=UPI00355BB28F